MKTAGFLALFLFALLPCFAQEVQQEFFPGYTIVTVEGYRVKVIAEQRRADRKVQVVVIPQQQGVHFNVHNVQFGKMPNGEAPNGPVAKVHGKFVIRSSNAGNQFRTGFQSMVAVEVIPVNEFSISADEARIQGNTCIERDLPKMLSE